MSDHKTSIEGFTLESLAEEVGNLRYDSLRDFLNLLSQKIEKDSISDDQGGRFHLSSNLMKASDAIWEASHYIKDSWKISSKFM